MLIRPFKQKALVHSKAFCLKNNVSNMRNKPYLATVMNVQDTQQKIIEAAILVFNEDPSSPLEKVAEKALVTRRTLHRYFKDRNELVQLCEQDIRRNCRKGILAAMNSSSDALKQLEHMLYAGIDCGVKYSFFYKMHNMHDHQHHKANEACVEYDEIDACYKNIIKQLQQKRKISKHVTLEWVKILYNSIIIGAINAQVNHLVERKELKNFAWFSFSKGIGA
jgi:AcrR family transcriptional regulator